MARGLSTEQMVLGFIQHRIMNGVWLPANFGPEVKKVDLEIKGNQTLIHMRQADSTTRTFLIDPVEVTESSVTVTEPKTAKSRAARRGKVPPMTPANTAASETGGDATKETANES